MAPFEPIPQGCPLWTLIVRDNELAPALIIGWNVYTGSTATPIFPAGTLDADAIPGHFIGLYLTEAEAVADKDKAESEGYR